MTELSKISVEEFLARRPTAEQREQAAEAAKAAAEAGRQKSRMIFDLLKVEGKGEQRRQQIAKQRSEDRQALLAEIKAEQQREAKKEDDGGKN